MPVLELDPPLPGLQSRWLKDPRARKVLPIGRRGAKTGGCWIAATAGHGEGEPLKKQFGGIFQGKDVLWFAQDFPNLTKVVWDGYIVPTFSDFPLASLNERDHTLSIRGHGTLYLLSGEALDGARGLGKNVGGVIIDEAAHLDLKKALLRAVLPMLIDLQGWLILSSSTNSGLDGNPDHRVPSYFNIICDEIEAGKRPTWGMWEGTAYDNPVLSVEAIQEFIAEYANDPTARDEEVYAKRLAPGGGKALPALNRADHLIQPLKTESWWTYWGSFDWGFQHPWGFGLFCADTQGNAYLVDSIFGREDLPDVIAQKTNNMLSRHDLRADKLYQVACGHDTWHEKRSHTDNTPTIAERLMVNGITRLLKANIDRPAGLNNLRWYLATKNAVGEPQTPAFRIFETESNRRVYDTLERMVIDPKRPEDVMKVNAIAGQGGDEGYDIVRYGLSARPYKAREPNDGVLDDINAKDVLLAEYDRKYRTRNVKAGSARVSTRSVDELDPAFGEF